MLTFFITGNVPNDLDISNTLVSIGSHDIALDIVNDLMCNDNFNLASSHLGSFSGVLAMKNKEAHFMI